MSTSRASIVVVGSINADLVARVDRHPQPGETLHGEGGDVGPGGKGANQAVAAALLGGDVTMVGAVGDDAHAEPALSRLRESGASLEHVRTVPGPTGLAIVTVSADGENAIVVIRGANAAMDAAAVDEVRDLIAGAGVVVLQGEIPIDGIEEAARLCTGRLILNPAPVVDLDPEIIRAADPLVVNEHEGQLVLDQLRAADERGPVVQASGVGGEIDDPTSVASADPTPMGSFGATSTAGAGGAPAAGSDAEPEAIVRQLIDAGARSVVLTLGAEGAITADPDPVRIDPVAVTAVDSTGAGDAYVGALAVRLMEGDGLADACRFASRVSAFAVEREGAQQSYPTAGELA